MKHDAQHAKLNILVCEEDVRVLKRLESWVGAMGEDVFICSNGIEAFNIFQEKLPDILLVSNNLKNMSGLELIQKVKEITPTQAVILMLSDEGTTAFKHAIELQVDKYLNKPVEASLLFKAVETLSQEKLWHTEFIMQKRVLQDYKDAIDLSFSVSKHNVDGNLFYVNDLFCSTTKLEYKDAIKGVINPLQNPNENMDVVWDALKNSSTYSGRQVFKIENSRDKIIDITAVALKNENDVVYEYLVFSNDVSDIIYAARKIKRQEIDSKLQKLEHVKELNKVKDSLLTVFTHELKTPLNSIINFSNYIQKHLAKEEFAKRDTLLEQISEINTGGWFMLDMINNLMEAIKLKNSTIELDIIELSVNSVIETILIKYTGKLASKNLQKVYDKDLLIFSDETRLTQIVDNIISNAIKYSNSEILIDLTTTQNEFALEIIDDGEGFVDKNKVFGLFEQSDENSMTRTASGTGVGLYIVKQLCDRMGYKIEILDSEKLCGARVIIRGKRDIR